MLHFHILLKNMIISLENWWYMCISLHIKKTKKEKKHKLPDLTDKKIQISKLYQTLSFASSIHNICNIIVGNKICRSNIAIDIIQILFIIEKISRKRMWYLIVTNDWSHEMEMCVL
ncbi:hypothetical protein V1478_013404 [Vespula squamosa]|uniref:Uncharacterized protein n=1 Tax=Vespula squamosa TaxID=30214 RepID=A0ABD2AAR1_VESSQ